MESNLKTYNIGNIKGYEFISWISYKSALLKDEALVKEVGSRIYPLVIPEGAPEYPFIVYGSAGISPTDTKDGSCEDNVNASVVVVSKTYSSAIRIANMARYALEGVSEKYKDFEVRDCMLYGSSEDYCRKLTLSV